MGNKKSSKLRKKERRLAEVSRAQNARTNVVVSAVSVEDKNDKFAGKSGYRELPQAEIKKDMIKNAAFLVFAIAVIAGIKISGWSL